MEEMGRSKPKYPHPPSPTSPQPSFIIPHTPTLGSGSSTILHNVMPCIGKVNQASLGDRSPLAQTPDIADQAALASGTQAPGTLPQPGKPATTVRCYLANKIIILSFDTAVFIVSGFFCGCNCCIHCGVPLHETEGIQLMLPLCILIKVVLMSLLLL